jgi:threonine 3-dehydrogenase
MIFKNLSVLGLNGRRIFDTWYRTRWLLESGAVDLRPLVTHEFPLEKIADAVALLLEGQACKVVLRPPGKAVRAEAAHAVAEPEKSAIRAEPLHR